MIKEDMRTEKKIECVRNLIACRDVAYSDCISLLLQMNCAASEVFLSVKSNANPLQILAALEANEQMFAQYPEEMMHLARFVECELNQLGIHFWMEKNYLGAEYAWRMLALAGREDGKLKMAALIRRGEYYRRGRYSYLEAMELLKEGTEQNSPFFLVNAALLQVLCVGGDEGWETARRLIERLDHADIGVVSRYWQQRAAAGDPEGDIVHFMLVRWRKLKYSPVDRWKELCQTVHAVVPRLPKHLLVGEEYVERRCFTCRGKEYDILFTLVEGGKHYIACTDGSIDEDGAIVVNCRSYRPKHGCSVCDDMRLHRIRTEEEWDLMEYWVDVTEEEGRTPLSAKTGKEIEDCENDWPIGEASE